jgi:hypothetical protein
VLGVWNCHPRSNPVPRSFDPEQSFPPPALAFNVERISVNFFKVACFGHDRNKKWSVAMFTLKHEHMYVRQIFFVHDWHLFSKQRHANLFPNRRTRKSLRIKAGQRRYLIRRIQKSAPDG